MREETRRLITAFRQALELAAGDRADECRTLPRWSKELKNFPHGSCDLASNFLAQYLKDRNSRLAPYILCMEGNTTFREEENSTVNGHVIVALNGEYIDLTLDQFCEYPHWIIAEKIESVGVLGTLLRKIQEHEGTITTRNINLYANRVPGQKLYNWLRDVADGLMPPEDRDADEVNSQTFISGE